MSLTYGYDLTDGDKMLEAPHQTTKLMAPLVLPGAALVNYLPICTVSNFINAILVMPYSYCQCGTFLHGSHISAMSQCRELSGS